MVATVRNFTNMELHGSIIYALELTDFPTDAKRNQQVLINGVLWIYSLVGGILTWFPLNNQKNTYVHQQALPSLAWNVQHGLGSEDFVLGVYGPDNNLMSFSNVSNITDGGFTLNFTEPEVGRAVAIFQTEFFTPSVTAQDMVTDVLAVGNGAVIADSSGVRVNGNPVLTVNSLGYSDYGTL